MRTRLLPGETVEDLERRVLSAPPSSPAGADRSLASLEPDAQPLFSALIEAAAADGVRLGVTETRRSQDRQDELFRVGRTGRGAPVTWTLTSNHTPGRAVDFDTDSRGHRWLSENAGKFGLRTIGDFDPGHVEVAVRATTRAAPPASGRGAGGTWEPEPLGVVGTAKKLWGIFDEAAARSLGLIGGALQSDAHLASKFDGTTSLGILQPSQMLGGWLGRLAAPLEQRAGEAIEGAMERYGQRYEGVQRTRLADVRENPSARNVGAFVRESLAEGLGSGLPIVGAGLVGGPPLAAAVGYGVGVGDVRHEMQQAGVTDPDQLAKYSLVAGVPYAALEVVTELRVAKQLLGMGVGEAVVQEAARPLARRLLAEVPRGMLTEGLTEGAQKQIAHGAGAHAQGQDVIETLLRPENIAATFEEMAAGAVGGGGFGTVGALAPDGHQQAAPPPPGPLEGGTPPPPAPATAPDPAAAAASEFQLQAAERAHATETSRVADLVQRGAINEDAAAERLAAADASFEANRTSASERLQAAIDAAAAAPPVEPSAGGPGAVPEAESADLPGAGFGPLEDALAADPGPAVPERAKVGVGGGRPGRFRDRPARPRLRAGVADPAVDATTELDEDGIPRFGGSASAADFLEGLDEPAPLQGGPEEEFLPSVPEPERPRSQAQSAFRQSSLKAARLGPEALVADYKAALRNAFRVQADEAASSSVFNRGRLTQAEQRVQALQNELERRRIPVPVAEDAWREIPDSELPVELRDVAARLRAYEDDDALDEEHTRLAERAEQNAGDRRAVEEMMLAMGELRRRGMYEARDPRTGMAAAPRRTPGTQAAPARSPGAAGARIPLAPLEGPAPRFRDRLLVDLGATVGRRIRTGRIGGGSGRAAGVYHAGSARTVIRYRGDLDTAAHEIAHAMDDAYGLVATAGARFDPELLPAFSDHGSTPPDGHPDPEQYRRAEAVAEWIRAWVVNPDEAQRAAPSFARHFEETLPEKVRTALRVFGDDVRRLGGAPAVDRTLANIGMEAEDPGVAERIRQAFASDGYAFKTRWIDKLDAQVRDALAPFFRGVDAAVDLQGGPALRPSEDPRILVRLLGGVNDKVDDVLERGPITAEGERVDGLGGVPWLLEPLAHGRAADIEREMGLVAAYMVSERAVEKAGQIDAEIAEEAQRRRDRVEERYASDRRWLDRQAEKLRRAHGQVSARVDRTVGRRAAAEAAARGDQAATAGAELDGVAALMRKREEHRLRLKIRKLEASVTAGNRKAVEDRIERLKAASARRAARYDRMRAESDRQLRGAGAHADEVAAREIERLKRTIDRRRAAGLRRVSRAEDRQRREAEHRKATSLTGAGAGIGSDLEIARAAIEEVRAEPELLARVEEAAARYRAWSDAMLQYMRDKGRISADAYDQIKARNEYYVAMHRLADELGGGGGAGGRKLGSAKETLQAWKGGSRAMENPYVNLLRQTESMLKEADRNEALRSFRDLLVNDRGMGEGDVVPLDAIGSRAEEGDEAAVKIFVDGELERWQFEEGIHQALKGWDQSDDNSGLMYLISLPGRVLRAGVTRAPDFLVRNALRDAVHRPVMSRVGSKPWDIFARLAPEDVSRFRRAGGGQAGHFRTERTAYHRELKKRMQELAGDRRTILATPARLLEAYDRLASGSEMVGRMAEFRRALTYARETLKYGERDAQLYAAYQARDLIDYAVAGTLVRKINRIVPFTNPAVQGLARAVRTARENPRGAAIAWSLYALAPTILAYAWAGRDEEELAEYRQLPAYQRDMFWNFKLGPDAWLRMPKSFEAGILATGVERAIDRLAGNAHAFEGYWANLAKSLLPIDEAAFLGPARVAIELSANFDFFRERSIVPPSEEGKAVRLRKGTARASRLGKALAALIPGEQDPRAADHFMRGQFAGLGKLATLASDVGRTDRRGRTGEVGSALTGLFTPGPVYGQDVQALLLRAKYLDRERSPEIESFRDLLERAQSAPTPAARDELARAVRKRAAVLRERYDKLQPTPKPKRFPNR